MLGSRSVARRLTGGSAGILFYNNAILSETSGTPQNNHWRNNLMLGDADARHRTHGSVL